MSVIRAISTAILFIYGLQALCQNTFDAKKFNLYDIDNLTMSADSGKQNDQSQNRIFIPGRKFTYGYTLKKNNRLYRFAVVPGKTVGLGNVVDWIWAPVDSILGDKVYPIETIDLHVYRNKKIKPPLPPEYTEIRYEYMNEGRRIHMGETTSVVENAKQIFVHPPRKHGFVLTEFNAFPLVSFPLDQGKTWARILTFPNSYFQAAKLKHEFTSEFSNLNFEYKVAGEVNVYTKLGTIICKKIEATGEALQGNTFATFYFNEHWGFVKTEYRNIDGSEMTFQLLGVKDID